MRAFRSLSVGQLDDKSFIVTSVRGEIDMRRLILGLVMLCLMSAGATGSSGKSSISLESIKKFELFSITPRLNLGAAAQDESKTFHGYPVLGRREIENKPATREIVSSLNGDLHPHKANLCLFSPRHALRIFYKESQADFLICYECGDVEKFNGNDDKSPEWFSVDKPSKDVLNRYLSEAKIPLAP